MRYLLRTLQLHGGADTVLAPMIALLVAVLAALRSSLRSRVELETEILALRHQLAVLQRQRPKRPQLGRLDRGLWVLLSRLWPRWRQAVHIVQPATVVAWHRRGWRLYWRWKAALASRSRRPGRPRVPQAVQALIRQMCLANPTWSAPRIHGELLKLGIQIAESTVGEYLVRRRPPASQTWRTFLTNHVGQLVAIDFFVVPTLTCRALFVFVVLAHERRRIVHFNVTEHPTAAWTAQQLRNAFPWDSAPRFLLRDRDGIYGSTVPTCLDTMGTDEVLTAPRSPWQNPYVERLIGSIRREYLDHVIVWNEHALHRHLKNYISYYHGWRTHLSLDKDTPVPRATHAPSAGLILEVPHLGGLHHHYERRAA